MRIGHYATDIWAPGGISSYMRRVGQAQAARGDRVLYAGQIRSDKDLPPGLAPHYVPDEAALFDWVAQEALDVLHVHKPLATVPPPALPILRTLHDHTANCPSGTRHLARSETPCDRVSTLATCTWGHLVDGCGSRRPQTIRDNFARIRRERRTLKTVTMHAISAHVKTRMVADGYDAEQIHVLHSPAPSVPPSYTPPPQEGTPRFLFLGRIVPEKGLAPLLRALTAVAPSVVLDVAGDGYQKPAMETLCSRLGLDDRVTFHGWVGPDRAHELMTNARAVVFPSLWNEPAGLITLEAAAAGRAVIASRAGGIPEYASDEYALLLRPGRTAALAGAISHLATHYDDAVELGQCGRRTVAEQFDMDSFLSGLDAIYNTVRIPSGSVSAS